MLAVIAGKLDPAHARVAACKLLYHLPCHIGAAVIHKYDFETDTDGHQRMLEAPVQFRKYLGGPVNRNDDRKGVLHRMIPQAKAATNHSTMAVGRRPLPCLISAPLPAPNSRCDIAGQKCIVPKLPLPRP